MAAVIILVHACSWRFSGAEYEITPHTSTCIRQKQDVAEVSSQRMNGGRLIEIGPFVCY